jgi:hypothetical protein
MTDTFAKQVWLNLSEFDCSDNVQQKGGLSYLSWANAWMHLMNAYPDSSFAFLDSVTMPSGTVEVHVSVTVTDGEHELTRLMTLPVMNYKNIAIVDPDSRDISDARMRCLVKCIALFGLGLFLSRGEDLPVKREKPEPAPLATAEQRLKLLKFMDAEKMSPRRSVWVSKNMERMTTEQAATILAECREVV